MQCPHASVLCTWVIPVLRASERGCNLVACVVQCRLKTFTGILHADGCGDYNPLSKVDADPNPLRQAFWAHARRKFLVLADIAANAKRGKNAAPISPTALEAVKRIDALPAS